jgi:hypothetical protein
MDIYKVEKYKSPGTDQVQPKLIKGRGEMKREIRLILIIIKESPSHELLTEFYPTFFWPG